MPDKIKAHYTTDEAYKNVGSNHLSEIRYDEVSLTLFIKFYNGSHYKYFGVPKELYEGMMVAPSHGTFFYHRIRQKYPYKLIDEATNQKTKPSILNSICPESEKLNKLDEDEEKLKAELNKGTIDKEEFRRNVNVLNSKRDKLITKLEKAGYFDEEEENSSEPVPESPLDYQTATISLGTVLGAGISTVFKCLGLVCKVLVIGFGVFFGLMGAMLH